MTPASLAASDGTATAGASHAAQVVVHGTAPSDPPTRFTIVGAPAHGAVTPAELAPDSCTAISGGISCSATFTYTPQASYVGPDSFTFTFTDQSTGEVSSPARIDVTVTGTAPVLPALPVPGVGDLWLSTATSLLPSATVDFGDGATATLDVVDGQAQLQHTYAVEGNYLLSVTNSSPTETVTRSTTVFVMLRPASTRPQR